VSSFQQVFDVRFAGRSEWPSLPVRLIPPSGPAHAQALVSYCRFPHPPRSDAIIMRTERSCEISTFPLPSGIMNVSATRF